MHLLPLLTTFVTLATLTTAQISPNAKITCDQGPRDATLQNPTTRSQLLSCINSLNKGLAPFQVGDFSGIRCVRNWHMFKKNGNNSNYFKTNADCLKGCGSCLRLLAREGHRTGFCSYLPDPMKWPSTMCVVGWQPLNELVCTVPPK